MRATLLLVAWLCVEAMCSGFSTHYGWANSVSFYENYRDNELYLVGDFPKEEMYGSSRLYAVPIEGDFDLPLLGKLFRAGIYGKIGLGMGFGFDNMGDWTDDKNRVKAGHLEKYGIAVNPPGPVAKRTWVYTWDYDYGLSATFSPYPGRKFTGRWFRRVAHNPLVNFEGSHFRGYRRSNVFGFSTDFITGLRLGADWDPLEGEKGETGGTYWSLGIDKFVDNTGTGFLGIRWESLKGEYSYYQLGLVTGASF